MDKKAMTFKEKLALYIDARLPILYVDTTEDNQIDSEIHDAAKRKGDRRTVLEWSQVNGFRNYDTAAVAGSWDLAATLKMLIRDKRKEDKHDIPGLTNTIIILKDAVPFLDKPEIISCLKYIAQQVNLRAKSDEDEGIDCCTIIIIAPFVNVPKELAGYITVISPDVMEVTDIKETIQNFVHSQQAAEEVSSDTLDIFAAHLKGLTETEIFNILKLVWAYRGKMDDKVLPLILEQKQQIVRKSGILETVRVRERMEDIGGLEVLKEWLNRKAEIFKEIEKAKRFGVVVPKGVLIVGMPGCGKSLTAKAASQAFAMPLLRMDMGRLMGKYVGESEANMRRAIMLTEASSPCILWIDELEKAFAGIGGQGGTEVTTRLFGNFLTWMQEKESLAFVVATANDITKLPPELLRKGRFDEIFCVGLPNDAEREKIFQIHIGKAHAKELSSINIGELVQNTQGYCGADIEGVVHDAIEMAFLDKKMRLETKDVLAAIKNTHSISETMRDSLEKMKANHKNRKFKNASR